MDGARQYADLRFKRDLIAFECVAVLRWLARENLLPDYAVRSATERVTSFDALSAAMDEVRMNEAQAMDEARKATKVAA